MSTMIEERESAQLGKSMKRSNKPMMEKRRRERINTSLNQLKSLVLEALKKDTSQYSKLEKADILEMTVRHLRGMQRSQLAAAASTDASVMGKFRLGYTECASEVARYLSSVDGLSPEVHTRLMNHLSGNCQRLSQAPEPTMTSQPSQPIRIQIPMATQASALPGATVQTVMAPSTTLPQQISRVSPVSAQPAQYVTGAFHVIPHATMTSPEMTVIMPNNVSPNNIISNVTPLYLNTSNVTSVPNQAVRIQPTAPVLTATVRPVPQQPDHPKVMSPPLTSAQYKEVMHPQGLTHKQQLLAVEIPPVHAKGVMLREEKVWRPW